MHDIEAISRESPWADPEVKKPWEEFDSNF